MTPTYHVGQILYHRASGERAIVANFTRDGSAMNIRCGPREGDGEIASAMWVSDVYSTEPVVVPSGFYPIEKPTEPGWYWWKSGSLWTIRVEESEGKLCAIERDQHWFISEKSDRGQWYGPKIPMP